MKLFEEFRNYLASPIRAKGLSPFSNAFSRDSYYDLWKNLVKSHLVDDDNFEPDFHCDDAEMDLVQNFIDATELMSSVWGNTYKTINECIQIFNCTGKDAMRYIVALNNRNDRVIFNKFIANMNQLQPGEYSLTDISYFKIESSSEKEMFIDARAAQENATDGVCLLIIYLSYFFEVNLHSDQNFDEKFASVMLYLQNLAQSLNLFKTCYDDVLYNNGFIKYNHESKKLEFDFANHRDLLLLKAGDMMLQQHIFHISARIHDASRFSRYLSDKGITICSNEDGQINIKTDVATNEGLIESMKELEGAIQAYYEFIQDVSLPRLDNLTLNEVLVVWAAIRYVAISTLVQINSDCALFHKEDFRHIPQQIDKNHLIITISELVNISMPKIEKAISCFISQPGKRYDIWTAPLYQVDENLLFPLFPINNNQMLNLIDHILKIGGINLDVRGKWMERYIIDHLNQNPPKYKTTFIGSKKYELDAKNIEEIDLMGSLKNLIIVGEIKCIRYSMGMVNYRDAWERLKEGCKQAMRKSIFVRQHAEQFRELGDYDNKEILPVVITNYPLYTGFVHDGVYVTDVHSLLSYLENGAFTIRSYSKEESHIEGGIPLYTNEDEYSSNLKDFLKNNPVKENLMQRIKIRTISPKTIFEELELNITYANFENDTKFNLHNGL